VTTFIVPLSVVVLGLLVLGVAKGYKTAQASLPAHQFPADASTPHGALRVYLSAWERRDLDAMVAAKDFTDEATAMLAKVSPAVADEQLLKQTAETLELAFRAQWQQADWPDTTGAVSFFSQAITLQDGAVRVNHVVKYSDGRRDWAKVRLVRRGASWRVSHAPL
jgi:hypothetical protein